jgi:phosphate transport system substrate-binding protein
MIRLQRFVGAALIAALAILCLNAIPLRSIQAQAGTPTPTPTVPPTNTPFYTSTPGGTPTFTVDGSKIVSPILAQATAAYAATHPDVKPALQVSGTSGGFDKLCAGTTDLAMANGGISDAQSAACDNGKVQYVELLLGFDAAVLVVNSNSKLTCVAPADVAALLSPAAAGKIQNWNQVPTGTPTTPLPDQTVTTVYASNDSRARDLIGALVPGGTLRADIKLQTTGAVAVDNVVADANSIAILSLADYQQAKNSSKAVKAVDLKNGNVCTNTDTVNLEAARYPSLQALYLYANVTALNRAPVADFLKYLVGTDGQSAVTAAGFGTASATSYTRDQNYLNSKQIGRTFSRIQAVNVPADTAGTLTVNGAPAAFASIKAVADAFNPRYSKIVVTQTTYGNDAGFAKLCAGGVDLIGATRAPSAAESAACSANQITPIKLTLGSDAAVLMVNAGNTFASCLTTDQLAKLFGAAADGKVKKWSDVSDQFPATDLLILTPTDGSLTTDLLITKVATGVAPLPRFDTTQSDDPLYRATGTANVAGAITYASYADYQKIKAANAKVTTVQVNSGKGCIAPTDQTLADGTYPLGQSVSLYLNPTAFGRPEVKAFVWYLLSDDALTVLSGKALFTGLDQASFVNAREPALALFAKPPAAPVLTPGPGTPTLSVTATTAGLNPLAPIAPNVPTVAGTAAATVAAPAAATVVPTIAATVAAPAAVATTAPTAAATVAATANS